MEKFIKILCSVTAIIILLSSCAGSDAPSGGGAGNLYRIKNAGSSEGDTSGADGTETKDPSSSVEDETEPESGADPEENVPEGAAAYSGSEADGTLKYVTHTGKTVTDFSFLGGLSRNFFSDTDPTDETGSWFCGKTKRDETTGEVTYVWDRASDVLDTFGKYGVIYRKNTDKKVMYITFDCGYENGYTGIILDILKEKEVPAAFFLNGHFISESHELVRRMIEEGHIVGNHGNNHKVMSKLSVEEFFYEIESNNELLRQYVPEAPYMKYFRPSYGSCSEWDIALAHEMDLTEVLYSWTYYDYAPDNQPTPEDALAMAKEGIHDGSVIMFHTVGETNTKILGDFIDYARSQGYEFGSLDD